MTIEENIKECEKNKTFDAHINDPDLTNCYEVDETYNYLRKGLKAKLGDFFNNLFVIKPYSYHLKHKYGIKVKGKENLKGIKNAIFTSNHVDIFDCLVIRRSLRKKLRIVAAPFNNQKGRFGNWMRSGGMMPLSENYGGMKKFNEAVKYYLEHKTSILIYPEGSMWPLYKKPRPHKVGAYHYAVKYDKPIVPLFITFDEKNHFTLNILKPIYRNIELDNNSQKEDLKNRVMKELIDLYEKTYNVKYDLDIFD